MIVREDSLTLYGFADADARDLFATLQTVSGVGPRIALATLAVHDAPALRQALADGDVTALTRVPGIGKRGAERMVLELRDKVGAVGPAVGLPCRQRPRGARPGAWRPLSDLASPAKQAEEATDKVLADEPEATQSTCAARGAVACWATNDEPLRRDDDDDEPDGRARSPPALTVDEGDIDAGLRPRSLGEFIGQPRVREQLQLVLEGAKHRGGTPDHILLSGPPGLGKTTLAMIIAAELGTPLRVTSGPALQRAGDLAAMLSNLVEGDVLFIDEIHRMARPAEEMLYLAMEDFRVDVVVGKGPGATSIPLERRARSPWSAPPPGPGVLTGPLRDRFGFTAHMDFYEPAELERVLTPLGRACSASSCDADGAAPRSPGAPAARRASPTGCCAGCATTPRCTPTASITRDVAHAALAVYDVDELGLDRLDRAVLDGADAAASAADRSGCRTLAVAVGEEADTVEEVCRAVPGARRDDRPHPARPGRHGAGLDAPRHDPAARGVADSASRVCSSSQVDGGAADGHRRTDFRGPRRAAARLHLRHGVADLDVAADPRDVRYHARKRRRPPSCWPSTRASTTCSWRS